MVLGRWDRADDQIEFTDDNESLITFETKKLEIVVFQFVFLMEFKNLGGFEHIKLNIGVTVWRLPKIF